MGWAKHSNFAASAAAVGVVAADAAVAATRADVRVDVACNFLSAGCLLARARGVGCVLLKANRKGLSN